MVNLFEEVCTAEEAERKGIPKRERYASITEGDVRLDADIEIVCDPYFAKTQEPDYLRLLQVEGLKKKLVLPLDGLVATFYPMHEQILAEMNSELALKD